MTRGRRPGPQWRLRAVETHVETFRIPGTVHRLVLPMLVLGLLPAGIVVPLLVIPGGSRFFWALAIAAVVVLLTRKYAWVIARRVEVSPQGLRIVWALRSRSVPRHEITDVHLVLWETLERPERWGRDGFHGLWDSPHLGQVELYATEPGNLAMVHLHTGPPLLLGVEFPDELVEAVETDILQRSSLL